MSLMISRFPWCVIESVVTTRVMYKRPERSNEDTDDSSREGTNFVFTFVHGGPKKRVARIVYT
jgi:hypothetical protein